MESTALEAPFVTWKSAARYDVLGHVLAWMLGFVVLAVPAAWLLAVLTGRTPQEPWSEIVVGVGAIAALGFGLLRWRAARVSRLLAEGRRVEARIETYLPTGMWAVFTVSYEIEGERRTSRVTVPNTKRSRQVARQPDVSLAVAPDGRPRPVVIDLYRAGQIDSGRAMP